MNSGDLVVVACGAPREKYWGVLIGLDAVGATLRAIPVAASESNGGGQDPGGPPVAGASLGGQPRRDASGSGVAVRESGALTQKCDLPSCVPSVSLLRCGLWK